MARMRSSESPLRLFPCCLLPCLFLLRLCHAFDPPSVFPISTRQALVQKSKQLNQPSQYSTTGWSNRAGTALTPVHPDGVYTGRSYSTVFSIVARSFSNSSASKTQWIAPFIGTRLTSVAAVPLLNCHRPTTSPTCGYIPPSRLMGPSNSRWRN